MTEQEARDELSALQKPQSHVVHILGPYSGEYFTACLTHGDTTHVHQSWEDLLEWLTDHYTQHRKDQ